VAAHADWSEDEDLPRPNWLPDGFDMEGYKKYDDTFQATVCQYIRYSLTMVVSLLVAIGTL